MLFCLNFSLFSLRTNTGWWDHKPSCFAQYSIAYIGADVDSITSPPGSVPVSASLDCLVAEQGCIQEQSCMVLYRLLEYCAAEEAVSPLGPDARMECLEAQNALQHYRPLQVCKCQRGSRREEHCLRVYWTVRFAGRFKHWHLCKCTYCICACVCLCVWSLRYIIHVTKHFTFVLAYDEYEVSPYEELKLNLVRNIEMSRMASIVAGTAPFTYILKFGGHITLCHVFFMSGLLHCFLPDCLQLPLFLWMAKTSV